MDVVDKSTDNCESTEDGGKNLLRFPFPNKLWEIVENNEFKSIRWNEKGDCVVIEEDLFKIEVLERKVPLKIFETDNLKSFTRQLNLYGFSKIRQNQKSASVFQLYHNANFKRGFPLLIGRMKRKVNIKSNIGTTTSPQRHTFPRGIKRRRNIKASARKPTFELKNKINTSYSASPTWPVQFDQKNQNDTHYTSNENLDRGSPNSICEFLPAISTTGFQQVMDRRSAYAHFASMNDQLTALMSFFNPWFSLISAATSVQMTDLEHHQFFPTHQRCPTCSCGGGNDTSVCYAFGDSESTELSHQE